MPTITPRWPFGITIPYISIEYDRYWHQVVFGYAEYTIGVGMTYWKRLFGVGRPWH